MSVTPRIAYKELPLTLQQKLRSRVERLGYLGEFFQVAAHQPEPLSHFIDFTESLRDALDWRLVETIALTVAVDTGNDYERVQHERLALKHGMERSDVRTLVSRPSPDVGALSPAERATVRLAREVVASQGRGCVGAFEDLAEIVGHSTAVGCLMLAVRYLAHATMANTWGLRPPVTSPFAEGTVRV